MLKRILYLGYYFKTLEKEKLLKFLNYAKAQTQRSATGLVTDAILSSLKYNISIMEYFQFRFYELGSQERGQYAGTGYMYEYQLIMNPKASRGILEDKLSFYQKYSVFVKHAVAGLDLLKTDRKKTAALLDSASGKLVLKYSKGQCGLQVRVMDAEELRNKDLAAYMKNQGFDMAEEYIVQHPELMKLSPSGVNTVRIVTQLTPSNVVEYLGARLRITVNSSVDNMASGNFAATIDITTGVVDGVGVYSDITKSDVSEHPVTGVAIEGFQVPFWEEILEMTRQAALLYPENRSIGWDVAVTEAGPELIEGNHDWCKLLWQLPAHKGLKELLDQHLIAHRKGEV